MRQLRVNSVRKGVIDLACKKFPDSVLLYVPRKISEINVSFCSLEMKIMTDE